MTQLSRPFQIALAAVVLFALVWVVALRGHSASSSSTPVAATPAPTAAPSAAAQEKAAAAPTKVYHGAAPGLEGLTRDINHAHGAVATSQREAHTAEGASAETTHQGSAVTTHQGSAVSSSSTTVVKSKQAGGAPSKTVTVSKSTTVIKPKHGAAATSTTVTVTKSATSATGTSKSNAIPPRQAAVESELKRGEVVVVLFWNPLGADDDSVHTALQTLLAAHHEIRSLGHQQEVHKLLKAVGLELDKRIAVHYASASQVTSFGSFTKTVQVYATPTTLIINKHGAVTTLNGLTDAFAIEQTIDEARHS
jgi:hypothetical protein